jgi:hypothetical protein
MRYIPSCVGASREPDVRHHLQLLRRLGDQPKVIRENNDWEEVVVVPVHVTSDREPPFPTLARFHKIANIFVENVVKDTWCVATSLAK